jgi:restriction system protein
MTLWVVRAGKYGGDEQFVLDNDVAVIGWSDLPDLSRARTRDELKSWVEQAYPNHEPRKVGNVTGQTWNFSHEIAPHDLVALPLHGPSAVAIGMVKGGYTFVPDASGGTRHRIPVKWGRKDIPRTAFDADILLSLNGQMTVYRPGAENAEERIKALLTGTGKAPTTADSEVEKESIDLETTAGDEIRQLITQRFKSHDFAQLIAALLTAQGYELHVSSPGPDGGVDILAGSGALGFDAPQIAVQVKSSNSPLGATVVRELLGVMSQFKAKQGLIVSWGGFKDTAIKEARQQFFSLRLWDSGNVVVAIQQHYEKLPDSIRAELPLKRIWVVATQSDSTIA